MNPPNAPSNPPIGKIKWNIFTFLNFEPDGIRICLVHFITICKIKWLKIPPFFSKGHQYREMMLNIFRQLSYFIACYCLTLKNIIVNNSTTSIVTPPVATENYPSTVVILASVRVFICIRWGLSTRRTKLLVLVTRNTKLNISWCLFVWRGIVDL